MRPWRFLVVHLPKSTCKHAQIKMPLKVSEASMEPRMLWKRTSVYLSSGLASRGRALFLFTI